jgi:hypothetical protein
LGAYDDISRDQRQRCEQEDPQEVRVTLDALARVVHEAVSGKEVLQVTKRDVRIVDTIAEEALPERPCVEHVHDHRRSYHAADEHARA